MSTRVRLTIDLDLSDEFLGDILVTAFDGDCGASWSWAEPKGSNWLVTDPSDPEGESTASTWRSVTIREQEASSATNKKRWCVIDHAQLVKGITRLFAKPGHAHLKDSILAKDSGEIGADGADTIVQFAMFGEEVYG